MMTPTTIKVTQYFNKVMLTPITSTPMHETMKMLHTELKKNAMSVPTYNKPFRYLVLTMTSENYILKSTDIFAPPTNNPGTGLTIASGATAPTITQDHWLFQVEKKLHNVYYEMEKVLKL